MRESVLHMMRLEMRAHHCRRCGKFWCSNTHGDAMITHMCPDCVAKLPILVCPMTAPVSGGWGDDEG